MAGRNALGAALIRRALAVIAVVPMALVLNFAQAAELQTLEIASKSGVHAFQVEMAITPEEKEHGLMFRRELPDGQGMLFDFQTDQNVAFWMKNTYIPLDMLFIRSDGRILRIAENTEPLSERNIPSGGPVRAVLEVIGGTAKKLGIAPGDRVGGSIFKAR
jgi:uncharacterized membrane protein (UPF0127 family)